MLEKNDYYDLIKRSVDTNTSRETTDFLLNEAWRSLESNDFVDLFRRASSDRSMKIMEYIIGMTMQVMDFDSWNNCMNLLYEYKKVGGEKRYHEIKTKIERLLEQDGWAGYWLSCTQKVNDNKYKPLEISLKQLGELRRHAVAQLPVRQYHDIDISRIGSVIEGLVVRMYQRDSESLNELALWKEQYLKVMLSHMLKTSENMEGWIADDLIPPVLGSVADECRYVEVVVELLKDFPVMLESETFVKRLFINEVASDDAASLLYNKYKELSVGSERMQLNLRAVQLILKENDRNIHSWYERETLLDLCDRSVGQPIQAL